MKRRRSVPLLVLPNEDRIITTRNAPGRLRNQLLLSRRKLGDIVSWEKSPVDHS